MPIAAVRLYTSEEVVAKLGLKPTWLKNWITQDRVPHVRSGADRGVRFTAADIFEIGRMLPELQHLILRSGRHLERTDLDAAAAVTGSLT